MNEKIIINNIEYNMPNNKRNGFTFFRSFMEAIDDDPTATVAEKYAFVMGVIRYALDFKEPDVNEFSTLGKILWKHILPNVVSGMRTFLNGSKGIEYGGKGGAPRGNKNAKK